MRNKHFFRFCTILFYCFCLMGETKSRLKNPPNVPFQKAKSLAMGRALGVQLMCPNSHRAVNAKPQELQNSGSSNWSSGFRSSPRLACDSSASEPPGTSARCVRTEGLPILQVIHRGKIAERPICFQIPFCALPRKTWAFVHFCSVLVQML